MIGILTSRLLDDEYAEIDKECDALDVMLKEVKRTWCDTVHNFWSGFEQKHPEEWRILEPFLTQMSRYQSVVDFRCLVALELERLSLAQTSRKEEERLMRDLLLAQTHALRRHQLESERHEREMGWRQMEQREGGDSEDEAIVTWQDLDPLRRQLLTNSTCIRVLNKCATLSDAACCAICFALVNNNQFTLPRCNHAFHAHCARSWFDKRANCPLCRELL